MSQQILVTSSDAEVLDGEECRHHWIIEAPTGPVSIGVCQLCEAEREFKNYIDATAWGEDTSSPPLPESFPAAQYKELTEKL